MIRLAQSNDLSFLSECLVDTCRSLKKMSDNIYVHDLPVCSNENVLFAVSEWTGGANAQSWVYEKNGDKLACLCTKIGSSNFRASGVQNVGRIELCWVAEQARRSGLASRLLNEAEEWFKEKGVRILELSYLVENSVAHLAWSRMGFTPFRVSAYKTI